MTPVAGTVDILIEGALKTVYDIKPFPFQQTAYIDGKADHLKNGKSSDNRHLVYMKP